MVESAEQQTARELVLVSPSKKLIPLAASGDQVTIGPLLETGLWSVQPARMQPIEPPITKTAASAESDEPAEDDPRVVRVACNLVDPAESDLRPRGELADVESRALLALGGQSMWFYLTLLAAALIVAEWWLYQRRIVG